MDKKDKKEIVKANAILLAFVLLAILGQFFVSCSPRLLPPAEVKDSVRVEIRERTVHDTAYVEIPVIKEVNMTRDSSSHLENPYATSDAAVENGLLRHTLETRPQKIFVPVEVPVHDTTYVHDKAEIIVKEVPAQLTKWQAFQIILGRILGGLVFLIIAAWAVKKFVFKK